MLTRANYRLLILIALIASGVWLLSKTEFTDSIFLFIFLGIIPGTDYIVPAWVLMIVTVTAFVLALIWLKTQPLFIGSMEKQEQIARRLARKRVERKIASHKRSKTKPKRLRSA